MTKFEEMKAAIESACLLTRASETKMCAYRASRSPSSLQAAEESEKKAAEARNKAIELAKTLLG